MSEGRDSFSYTSAMEAVPRPKFVFGEKERCLKDGAAQPGGSDEIYP